MKLAQSQNPEKGTSIIPPNPRLPIQIILVGLILSFLPFNAIPGLIVSIFGIFLLIQTYTLRLKFTEESMIVLQLGKELRNFPYKKWLAWRILLPNLPGVFYFREEASPHLLPIIFNKNNLEVELRKRLGNLERPQQSSKSVT